MNADNAFVRGWEEADKLDAAPRTWLEVQLLAAALANARLPRSLRDDDQLCQLYVAGIVAAFDYRRAGRAAKPKVARAVPVRAHNRVRLVNSN